MKTKFAVGLASSILAFSAVPALAQSSEPVAGPPAGVEPAPDGQRGPPDSVFDDTWINIGIGVAYSPSYSGSDDYVLSPLPVVQGSVAGVEISPRPAGFALNILPDAKGDGPEFNLGPAFRIRTDRANQIEDPVVELAGELDTAIEVGPSMGISFPKLLNPFDSLSLSTDIKWDVAGAHGGMVIDPSITYSTPVNRGTFVSLSLGTEYVSDGFANYYYSVDPTQSAASGLAQYTADGGFTKVSATTLVAVDLDGNALNGGLNAVLIGGYSRLINDARNNPYTAVRGTANQFFVGAGLGYTF